jgi:chromosomal replication initiation ATPase DnaA
VSSARAFCRIVDKATGRAPAYSSLDPQANRGVIAISPVPARIGKDPADRARLKEVIAVVVDTFEVSPKQLLGKARPERIVRARFAMYRLAWVYLGCTRNELARLLGLNHGTILSGMKGALNRMETEREFRRQYQAAMDRLDTLHG